MPVLRRRCETRRALVLAGMPGRLGGAAVIEGVTVNWQIITWVFGVLIAWTAFLVGIIKWLIGRMIESLDERLKTNSDDCTEKWTQIGASLKQTDASLKQTDADLKRLMTELPLHYQRREDAIREYTSIHAKLDRIYELRVSEMRMRINKNE